MKYTSKMIAWCCVASVALGLKAQYISKLTGINYYGTNGLAPRNLTVFNDRLYFFGTDNSKYAAYLMYYDDASNNVTNVKQVDTFNYSGSLNHLKVVGSKLVFYDNQIHELWASDGSSGGTGKIRSLRIQSNAVFAVMNGKLYFAADSVMNGTETDQLWVSDGTTGGTHMVKQINATGDAKIQAIVAWNGMLYFSAWDGSGYQQLWTSDGTGNGTKLFKTLNNKRDAAPQFFTPLGNKLVFVANTGSNSASEVFATDGTSGGTVQITSVDQNGSYGMNPYGFCEYNGYLYFSGYDTSFYGQLWRTDGSLAGTSKVKTSYYNKGTRGMNPTSLVVHKGMLYFAATDSVLGSQLWKSDGTTAGTDVLTRYTFPFYPTLITSFGNYLVMKGGDSAYNKQEVIATDGTFKGTICPTVPDDWSTAPVYPLTQFVPYHNGLYYVGAYAVFSDYQLCRFTEAPVGVNSPTSTTARGIDIFPNPVAGIVHLKGVQEPCTLVLRDIHGRETLRVDFQDTSSGLNTESLAPGTYSLSVWSHGGRLLGSTVLLKP